MRPSELQSLNGFQAEVAFVFGPGFADPNHAASDGIERILIEDDFDYLAAPQMETAAYAEPIVGGIKHKARLSFEI